jgi:hypothetical protein
MMLFTIVIVSSYTALKQGINLYKKESENQKKLLTELELKEKQKKE